jgi:hypothetical protein
LKLSEAPSHSFCRHREEVDSRLLVVGSQTASLTLDPSFAHNLGWKCPNDSFEAILDIYTSKPFQQYKEHFKARCFSLCCWALKLRESQRTPSSHFWECESHPHILPKVGLRHLWTTLLVVKITKFSSIIRCRKSFYDMTPLFIFFFIQISSSHKS